MPPLRQEFDPATFERERRLHERRRLDRGEVAQRWIASFGGVWLIAHLPMLAALCAGADLPKEGFVVGGFSLLTSVVAGAFALVVFATAAAAATVALWFRTCLSAGWIVAGLAPWLLLVTEAAILLLIAATR